VVLDTGSQHAVGRLVHDGPLIRAESARPTSPNQTSGQSPGKRTRRSAVAQDYLRDGDLPTSIQRGVTGFVSRMPNAECNGFPLAESRWHSSAIFIER